MTRSQHIANRQETLLGDRKFSQVFLCGQIVFQKVTNLRLLHFVSFLFTHTNLDSIFTIFLLGLNLSDLAPIDLDNSAGLKFAPLVPKLGAAHFVAHQAHSFRLARGFLRRGDVELGVYLILERLKSVHFFFVAVRLSIYQSFVVHTVWLSLLVVLLT